MLKLAVLVSGTGSLLEAMLADHLPISLVVADRPCRGLDIARAAGVPTEFIERTDFSKNFDRSAYTDRVIEILIKYNIELVAMAGFMTVFDEVMFDSFSERVLNTHPALLPAFKGDHAVQDALDYGVKITGCTIHVATKELDEGRILAQEAVTVLPGDTKETLHERIKQVERKLYPQTIRQYVEELASGQQAKP